MKSRQRRNWIIAAWIAAAVCSGPATVAAVWLAAATGFVVLPGEAPKFSGAQGREHDFTEILATADETGGAMGMVRQNIAPNSGPPTHVHQATDEFLYVVSGSFKVKLGDRTVDAPAQSLVFVPRGTAHTFTNTGASPGTLLVGVTPGGYEKFFKDRQGVDKSAEQALFRAYQTEIVGPPLK